MKKITIIGGGAMGSAFTIPCLENNNKVTITEPYSKRFVKDLSSRDKFHSALKIRLPKKLKIQKIGNNVSIAHLSYVGDSEIGNNVNIGAGTITCNYDGKKKHKTIIKDNVFIGSNTSLIAPIVIESKSRIGAGSVITKNIPKNSLAIERSALKILRNKRSK